MRIGYFGGSFDPVHNGHLILAQRAREVLELDRLILAPTHRPPHKSRRLAPVDDRIRMVELAFSGLAWAELSRGETDDTVSYTIDALETIVADRAPSELVLIIGGDSLDEFHTWRSPEGILQLAKLAVYARPGDHRESRWPHARIDGPLVEISSTDIRERVRLGRSVVGWVPERVADYVIDRRLYESSS